MSVVSFVEEPPKVGKPDDAFSAWGVPAKEKKKEG